MRVSLILLLPMMGAILPTPLSLLPVLDPLENEKLATHVTIPELYRNCKIMSAKRAPSQMNIIYAKTNPVSKNSLISKDFNVVTPRTTSSFVGDSGREGPRTGNRPKTNVTVCTARSIAVVHLLAYSRSNLVFKRDDEEKAPLSGSLCLCAGWRL
jgi:hypothetical protein